jgi:hypothetical protein
LSVLVFGQAEDDAYSEEILHESGLFNPISVFA